MPVATPTPDRRRGRRIALSALTAGALSALPGCGGAAPSSHTLSATLAVVTAQKAGSLVFGTADKAATIAAYGSPAARYKDSLEYHCRRTRKSAPAAPPSCALTFIFGVRGRLAGRLAGLVAGAPNERFQTAGGVRIGMTVSEARKLAPSMTESVVCGVRVLRLSKAEGEAGSFAGVSLPIAGNRIVAIRAIRPGEPVACAKGGGYSIGY